MVRGKYLTILDLRFGFSLVFHCTFDGVAAQRYRRRPPLRRYRDRIPCTVIIKIPVL
jgi:hypothetical protein